MIARERDKIGSLADFLHNLTLLIDYHTPRRIEELMIFHDQFGETGYYLCPRCKVTLDREYVAFCDRCGQKIDWSDCQKAQIVFPRRENMQKPY